MTENNHERWGESLGAYMLGALDGAEVAELERHAEGCERCQAEMRWLLPAVDVLPGSVERIEPPGELRARLMAEVRSDARQAASADGAATRGGLWSRTGDWIRGLGSGAMGLRPVAGVAAAVLVVLVIGGYAIVGGLGSDGDGSSTLYYGEAPGVTARMIDNGDGGELHLANVRQIPDDRVLEAWVQRDGEVEAVQALFVPDREGRASTELPDMEGVEAVMVTAEPKGGSEAPTSAPIVTIPVPG